MQQISVILADAIDARLRNEAQRRGITVSELTREAIEAHLGGEKRGLRGTASGRSGRDDVSERIEEILADEGL